MAPPSGDARRVRSQGHSPQRSGTPLGVQNRRDWKWQRRGARICFQWQRGSLFVGLQDLAADPDFRRARSDIGLDRERSEVLADSRVSARNGYRGCSPFRAALDRAAIVATQARVHLVMPRVADYHRLTCLYVVRTHGHHSVEHGVGAHAGNRTQYAGQTPCA